MQPDFWHQRWEENKIGFHLPKTNQLLETHFHQLQAKEGACVFVPLCGKTLDIVWLLAQGLKVVGCELNESAVRALFEGLEIEPEVSHAGNMKCYESGDLKVFVGDFFELSTTELGEVDFVYDRAAFVALPKPMRDKYCLHLKKLTSMVPQLLITLCYEEHLGDGPPFRITEPMVFEPYGEEFDLEKLGTLDYENGYKGKHPLTETAWKLTKKES